MHSDEFCKKAAAISSLKELYSLFDACHIPRPSFGARLFFTLFSKKRLLFPSFQALNKQCSFFPTEGKRAYNKLLSTFIDAKELLLPIEKKEAAGAIQKPLPPEALQQQADDRVLAQLIGELYHPDLVQYQDIRIQAEGQRNKEALRALIQKGIARNRTRAAIDSFYKKMQKALSSFPKYADVQSTIAALQDECEALLIKKADFYGKSFDEVEALFQEKAAKLRVLQEREKELLDGIQRQVMQFQEAVAFQLHATRRRLFEIWTGRQFYKDLEEDLASLREMLFEKISTLLDQLFSGKITLLTFQKESVALTYEHDVLQLRGELDARAARLRELRLQAHALHQKYPTEVLEAFIRKIEDPSRLFSDVKLQYEDVNRIIRALWIELEALQEAKGEAIAAFPEEKELVERGEALRQFAKSLQFVKVFDEERVDTILEAFEHVGYRRHSESKEAHRDALLKAFHLVEEELLLDIGSLDRRALFDVDEKRLLEVLKNAAEHFKIAVPEKTIEGYLHALGAACNQLFQKRAEEAAEKGNPVALHTVIQYAVQQQVQKSGALFFEALKLLLLESQKEPLEKAINHIFTEAKELDQASVRQVYEHILRFESAKGDSGERALQYLPGHLAYYYQ